jgi:hypothetical protein
MKIIKLLAGVADYGLGGDEKSLEIICSIFYPKDGGSRFLQNIATTNQRV